MRFSWFHAALTALAVCGVTAVPSRAADPRLLPPGTLPRSAWGAAAPRPGDIPQLVRRLTVHHTESPVCPADPAKMAETLRSIQRYHQRDKHWTDTAYHLLIDRWGRVWEGRRLTAQGSSATAYDLQDRVLVCLVGNFMKEEVNAQQWEALTSTLAFLCHRYGIAPETITMHRQLAETDCPGDHLAARITDGSLLRAVRARLAGR